MKNSANILKGSVAVLLLSFMASCGQKATVNGVLEGCPASEVTVKLLDGNKYQVLDTLKTRQDGSFSYRMDVEEGQPQFVYFYHDGVKVASTILAAGDRVKFSADTLGNYTVEGSEESVLLAGVEKAFADFYKQMNDTYSRMESYPEGSAEYEGVRRVLADQYIAYYRDRLKYILSNSKSLTVIPVLYQEVGNLPVFAQQTDALHFSMAADSLETVYPDSKYVKALRKEAKARSNALEMNLMIQNAPTMGFPEIELPDVSAVKRKLTGVDSKVILVHFWVAAEAANNLYNTEVLKPLYEKYHDKGLEIYQIAMNADKAVWATVVKNQGLDWINVCDNRGSQSPIPSLWGVEKLPTSCLIVDGALKKGRITTQADLEKEVAALF